MHSRRIRMGALAAAAGAALLISSGPALASATRPASVTGPEVISGAVYGKAANAKTPHIPLTLTGVVVTTDRGFVLGNGYRKTHTLTTRAGRLTVTAVGKQSTTQILNLKTCHLSFTIRQRITFVPGKSTGSFAGASGPASYQVRFAAFFPRYTSGKHKGQCNTSNTARPLNRGAVASFLAAGVLTVR